MICHLEVLTSLMMLYQSTDISSLADILLACFLFSILTLWGELHIELKCQSVHSKAYSLGAFLIVFLASNILHNLKNNHANVKTLVIELGILIRC